MPKEKGPEPQGKKHSVWTSIASVCCFIALGVAAVLTFITYLLPLITDSISLSDNVINILNTITYVVSLIGLGSGALGFASTHGKIVKFLTALFVIVFIVAIVLIILNII